MELLLLIAAGAGLFVVTQKGDGGNPALSISEEKKKQEEEHKLNVQKLHYTLKEYAYALLIYNQARDAEYLESYPFQDLVFDRANAAKESEETRKALRLVQSFGVADNTDVLLSNGVSLKAYMLNISIEFLLERRKLTSLSRVQQGLYPSFTQAGWVGNLSNMTEDHAERAWRFAQQTLPNLPPKGSEEVWLDRLGFFAKIASIVVKIF